MSADAESKKDTENMVSNGFSLHFFRLPFEKINSECIKHQVIIKFKLFSMKFYVNT